MTIRLFDGARRSSSARHDCKYDNIIESIIYLKLRWHSECNMILLRAQLSALR